MADCVSPLSSAACRRIVAASWTPSSRIMTALWTASSGVAAYTTNDARSLMLPFMKPDLGNRVKSAPPDPMTSAYSSVMPASSILSTSSSPAHSFRLTGDLNATAALIRPDAFTTLASRCSPSRSLASTSTVLAGRYSFSITTG